MDVQSVFRYESFGYTSQELFMEWNEDNNVNANISLAQFAVFTSLVVPDSCPPLPSLSI
jgi:hypothetical protein